MLTLTQETEDIKYKKYTLKSPMVKWNLEYQPTPGGLWKNLGVYWFKFQAEDFAADLAVMGYEVRVIRSIPF